MSMQELFLKKAQTFYDCAAELNVQVQKLTEARDLLLKFGDQFSEAASLMSPPTAGAKHE